MKSIKFIIAAMLFSLTVAFFAFKPITKQTTQYWQYDGMGNVLSENSYNLVTGPPCSGSTDICAISAVEDPSNPDHPAIDSNLESRITNKDTSQGDVFLKN